MNIVDLTVNLAMSIVTGFVLGLIVTRMSRFDNLKNEARRVIRSMEFMQINENGTEIRNPRPDTRMLTHIASDFYSLGHREAGDSVNEIKASMSTVLLRPPAFDEVTRLDREWQSISRQLKPSWKALLAINFTA